MLENKKFYILFLIINFLYITNSQAASLKNIWTQIGPENSVIVRAITSSHNCPNILIDGKSQIMQVHNQMDANFPVTVCQIFLPYGTQIASIEGHRVPLLTTTPHKVIIIGDTGCRLKNGVAPQSCNLPKYWPFGLIARQAVLAKPDLVIHVGDYLYREGPCPSDDKGCLGSPHGDNWRTWNADFFNPAKPLLKAAPWIFVRGNHEVCERGGNGWIHFLDPFDFKKCRDYSPLYAVDITPNTRLFIMDSAKSNDFIAPPEQVNRYEKYLSAINNRKNTYNWLITHKPFWFIYNDNQINQTLQQHFTNTLQTAWQNVQPKSIDLIVAGHVHRFQTLNFASSRPPQIIVGAGGTSLDAGLTKTELGGLGIANETISYGMSMNQFGYLVLERTKNSWHGQMRNPYGKLLAECDLNKHQFICHETVYAKSKTIELK